MYLCLQVPLAALWLSEHVPVPLVQWNLKERLVQAAAEVERKWYYCKITHLLARNVMIFGTLQCFSAIWWLPKMLQEHLPKCLDKINILVMGKFSISSYALENPALRASLLQWQDTVLSLTIRTWILSARYLHDRSGKQTKYLPNNFPWKLTKFSFI